MKKDSFKQADGEAYSKLGPDQKKGDAAQWLEENRAALASYNAWVEQNGLPLELFRQF
jgi:post-segregation antitoxin (ccd killing protein)